MNDKQRKEYLLNKYINNECTEEEFNEFLEQVKTSSNFEDFDDTMQQHWQEARTKEPAGQPDWDSMRNNVSLRLWALKKTRARIKYAAIIAVVISITAGFFFYKTSVNTASINYLTEYSAPATTKVIVLPDGTKVTLNANSTLRYPEKLNGNTREVYLKGEAYFEVVHNVNKPFIIHSGKLRTNVLGTTFTISAYSPAQPMNVTVLTGKVAVKNEESRALAILTRGQWATALPGEKGFVQGKLAAPEDAIAWIDNKLIFENTDLQYVTMKLSNKYNVQINVKGNKLAHERITGIFQSQSLPDILKALTKLTHSTYTIQQNTYTIQY
jgi:transmembrane sensor